tara:strand:- start:352 stop:477 length:126 start_codon:yes stop_codon:yes gene_type:complete
MFFPLISKLQEGQVDSIFEGEVLLFLKLAKYPIANKTNMTV